jgi:lipid intermediate transporter
VYRHLLFNRLGRSDDSLDPSILRLGTLLVLFDVYLTWARVEKAHVTPGHGTPTNALSDAPILLQYLFFLTLNTIATLAQHATIRLLVRLFLSRVAAPDLTASPAQLLSDSPDKDDLQQGASRPTSPESLTSQDMKRTIGPGRASPSAVSTALLVSSCTKLFPILLVIWPTESSEDGAVTSSVPSFASRARSYIGWAVLLNNIEALLILLDCGYVVATSLALAGYAARWLVEGIILGTVGLDGDGGPIGDLSGFLSRVVGWFGSG